jgi:hypothetical protein
MRKEDPKRERPKCATCTYWDQTAFDPSDVVIYPDEKHKAYACRLYPAVVYKLADEWCGQHKAIPY